MPKDLFFRSPTFAIWLVLCLIVAMVRLGYLLYQRRKILSFGSIKSVFPLLQADSLKRGYFSVGRSCLCVVCVVLACMQPEGNIRYQTIDSSEAQVVSQTTAPLHQVILLIDTSQSMSVTDEGQNQSRLEKAKMLGEDIISALQGETLSVYAFTSSLTPIVPPTLDPTVGRVLLQGLHVNEGDVGGTDFVKTLSELGHFLKTGPSYATYTVLFFSDGGDLIWEKKHEESRLRDILQSLPQPPDFPIRFYTVGIGSLAGGTIPDLSIEGKFVVSKLEEVPLEQMARQGGGKFYGMKNTTSARLVQELLAQITSISEKNSHTSATSLSHSPWELTDLYYQLPLCLAMCLLFWELRRETWVLHLSALFWICTFLSAQEISYLDSERALAVGSVGEYSLAESLYQSFLLRSLSHEEQDLIFYNLGTLKLQQRQPKEALELFQKISTSFAFSPELLLRKYWNITLGMLMQADTISSLSEWRLYLSETALHQIQRLQNLSVLDRPLPNIDNMQREATRIWKSSLSDTKTKLLLSFSPVAKLFLLQEGVERLLKKLQETKALPSLWPILEKQTEILLHSWPPHVETSLPGQLQRALQQKDSVEASVLAKQLSYSLSPMLTTLDAKEKWFFDYRLALLSPVLGLAHLRNLLQQLEEWKPSQENLAPLQEGVIALEKQQFSVALFFLVAAYGNLRESYLIDTPKSPTQILSEVLAWQGQAWRLSHLFSKLPQNMATQELFLFAQVAAKKALAVASTFPQKLIEWQEEQKEPLCDPSFWQSLLSFFDQGIFFAQLALKSMGTFPPLFADLLWQQQRSMEAWQKALDWLEQIPPKGATSPQQASLEQQQALEILREMELEDRPALSKKSVLQGSPEW